MQIFTFFEINKKLNYRKIKKHKETSIVQSGIHILYPKLLEFILKFLIECTCHSIIPYDPKAQKIV